MYEMVIWITHRWKFLPLQSQDNVEDCEKRGWGGVHGMRIVLGLNESVNKNVSFVLIS